MVKMIYMRLSKLKSRYHLFMAFFKRQMWVRYAWIEWFLPFEILNISIGLATWYYYALSFNGAGQFFQRYGGFVGFLIIGMALNGLLDYSLNQPYNVVWNAYESQLSYEGVKLSMAEYLIMAKVPFNLYLIAQLSWGFIESLIRLFAYAIIGTFFLGFTISPFANYIGSFFIIMLGIIACLGIGLISASMVWLAGAWHGTEPILWFINLLVGLISGVYFPPEILPPVLRQIAYFLPQTYVLEATRLSILSGSSMELLLPYIFVLTIFCLIFLPLGTLLLKCSFKVAAKKGGLMQ